MRIRAFISLATQRLIKAQRDSPRRSAELLVCRVLSCDRVGLWAFDDRELTGEEENSLLELLAKREKGMPIAYLTGEKEFYGRSFYVSKETLIPRPETEHAVEAALLCLPEKRESLFADLGTGSGNIGLTLALECAKAKGILLDKSAGALGIAKKNAEHLNVSSRITFLRASFANLPLAPQSLDLVIANPPYIGNGEEHLVMDEVLTFEPESALFAAKEGFHALLTIIEKAPFFLKKNGYLILEHGLGQGKGVRMALTKAFTDIRTIKDYAGHERTSIGRKAS